MFRLCANRSEKYTKNQISAIKMRAIVSEGFADRSVSRNGPYDLIMANILAGPLRRMASRSFAQSSPQWPVDSIWPFK